MRDSILRASLVASLLLMTALVGAWPTRSDDGAEAFRRPGQNAPAEKRGRRATVTPLSYRSPGSKHKLLIPAEDAELTSEFLSSRATGKARKYGAYSLVEVSDQQLASLDSKVLERAQVRDDLNLVLLRRGQIDTAGPDPKISRELFQPSGLSHSLHLVQLFGPPTPDSLRAVEATGVKLVSYVPNNAYLVWATPAQLGRVRALRRSSDVVQWEGPYHPAYKLDPFIKQDSVEQIPASIQVLDTAESRDTISLIKSTARKVIMGERRLSGIIHIKILADSNRLADLALSPDVLFIERAVEKKLMDERANQIVAGALSVETVNSIQVSRPTSPGYLAFLNSLGFNSDFDFAIDIADTGFDIGSSDTAKMHPDFLNGAGTSRVAYLSDFTQDSHPNDASILPTHDVIGHGTINASIALGFNDKAGSAFADGQGFRYGLGVAPYARIGVSKVFPEDSRSANFSLLDYIPSAYRNSARISSNSFGSCELPICNLYDSESEVADSLVRDADPDAFGNQSMVIIFAAGNDGDSGTQSVAMPGTAKNSITVGASEGYRPTDGDGKNLTDRCGAGSREADNSVDIIDFSAFGPVQDGRAKPDIIAPGTHIVGAATQDLNFRAGGVCAIPGSFYFPVGQKLYTLSSGTSHSTPLVAGGAALAYQWFKSQNGAEPSPALVKAFMLNSTSYVGGKFGGDNLPGAHQGWGLLDLARMFEPTSRIVLDESPSRTFRESGGAPFEISGVISDSSKEFRVMLAWTDVPGNSATNAPYVNQLNLEVIVNGNVYDGNVFDGQYSAKGGQKDFLNNTQGVRLPAGTAGTFVIRVRPTVIAGDGVPGNGLDLDQDFALVVTNAREAAVPVLAVDAPGDVAQGVSVLHSNGTTDSVIIPGETAKITVTVSNKSQTATSTISAGMLSISSSGRTNIQGGPSPFPVIGPGQSGANAEPFELAIPSDLRCGSVAELRLVLQTTAGQFNLPVRVRVGQAIVTPVPAEPLLSDDVDGGRVKWKRKKGFGVDTTVGHSGTQSYHVVDAGKEDRDEQESTLLLKKAITIPADAGGVRLSFFHIFNFEPGFDGGVLEISDDGGDTWQDLGSRVIAGGYDGKVTEASNNPLGNRYAWTSRGRPGVFSQVVINLDDFAGKKVRLRFVAGFDTATGFREGYTGWFIDDIQITANRY
ncbi:MAG TPA: S8 family serine peptidase, partial [Blastocatellia bacterium]|nr:S8 family serine peptidase [Blastocatellia bacterium]